LGIAIDELARRHAFALCGDDVLQAVVIRAGHETNVAAAQPAVTRQDVGEHELVREAEVWPRVYVRNGGGDERRGHGSPPGGWVVPGGRPRRRAVRSMSGPVSVEPQLPRGQPLGACQVTRARTDAQRP